MPDELLIDPRSPGQMVPPDRVVYAEGVLLDARDFTAEQTYHRGRLARVLAYAHGSGTVVGLRVEWEDQNESMGRSERLRVSPGLAVDRLGRLIELGRDVCLRLGNWYADQDAEALRTSLLNPPADAITADVFVGFKACERGKTPAFGGGPFDILDPTVPARLRDSAEVKLVVRQETEPPLPTDPFSAVADAAPEDRLETLCDAILDGWHEGTDFADQQGLLPAAEHPRGLDTTSVFLARVRFPATDAGAETRPERSDDPTVDNHSRRFIYPPGALAHWLGIGS